MTGKVLKSRLTATEEESRRGCKNLTAVALRGAASLNWFEWEQDRLRLSIEGWGSPVEFYEGMERRDR